MPLTSVKILFFGESCQLHGKPEDLIELEDQISYESLKDLIFQKFPQLEKLRNSSILAVDQEYCEPGQQLHLTNFSEIAIIPPLSGG